MDNNIVNRFYNFYKDKFPEIMGVGYNSEQSDGDGNTIECEHLMVELSSININDLLPNKFEGIEVKYQKYD